MDDQVNPTITATPGATPTMPISPAPTVSPNGDQPELIPPGQTDAPNIPSPVAVPPAVTTVSAAPSVPPPPGDLQTVDGPMPGKYKIFIDRSKCISAGSCIAIAPKVLQFDEHNIATVISQDELDDIKLLAAQSCPVLAVIVQDITTGKVVWPEAQA